jgi:hypothetical protein
MTSTGRVFKISSGGGKGGLLHESANFGQTCIMFYRLAPKITIIHHTKLDVKTLKSQNSRYPNTKTAIFN